MALTRLGLYGGPRAALPSDVEITAGVDALTLTTYPASLGSDKNVSASTDALSLTTFAASIANDVNVAASVDALTLTTFVATITVGVNIAATTDALTLTENAASITFDVNVLAATDALVLTTYGVVIGDGSAVEEAAPAGGWRNVYDHYFQLKRKRDDAHKQEMAEIAALAGTDREIARILHKDLEFDARSQEIAKLDEIIQSLDVNTERQRLNDEVSEKAAKAFTRAYMQANFSALEAFERELQKSLEEEDFLLLALLILR